MNVLTRRKSIEAMIAGGAGLALANFSSLATSNNGRGEIKATENQTPGTTMVVRAFSGQHQPKPLPFNPSKLNGLSEKLIKSHWENNYGGAVKALNAVEQRLAAMLKETDLPPYVYGDLKREELVRTGSVVLHEYYFANLGGDGKSGGKIKDFLKQWFGSYEQWEVEFKKTANALGGGSGWTILAYNIHTGEVHNY